MDVSEHEADVRLYKASGELLSELQAKLPLLLQRRVNGSYVPRTWVFATKATEIAKLLDSFQEWPQLLDTHLAAIVHLLVEAFLKFCTRSPNQYLSSHDHTTQIWPLARSICVILYALCKVRGRKVIVRLLNNEAKYIEPLLKCFRLWGGSSPAHANSAGPMMWEERYIMLLWLSHLMLAPFELSSISGLASDNDLPEELKISSGLPKVALNILDLAINHLDTSSKAREAAVLLIVRLSLRGDMQKLQLPETMIDWAAEQVLNNPQSSHKTGYYHIGLLSVLFGMTNAASDLEIRPFLGKILATVHIIADSDFGSYEAMRDQAPVRKLLVKTIRAAMVHAIALSRTSFPQALHIDVDSLLENAIQTLLDYLADKDTPVRQAASKALSLITLKLDQDMAGEIIEAVLGSLDENILLENTTTGQLIPVTDKLKGEANNLIKNVSAVDPLRWHGAMLTLGHLLFRRSPPLNQLQAITEALLMGLQFEQRSHVGTSIGVGVRDAACFGLWSLARNYSTTELNNVALQESVPGGKHSTIQEIAIQLAASACLDPSGNLRRGSSAALQELIGRHPDVIVQGIPVVQIIDYHAVARRSRAMCQIAVDVSNLDLCYQASLSRHLLQWRGATATDPDSRRISAKAVGLLLQHTSRSHQQVFLSDLVAQIKALKPLNMGTNAATRHGLVLALSRALESVLKPLDTAFLETIIGILEPLLFNFEVISGTIPGRINPDLENVLEASAKLICAIANLLDSFSLDLSKNRIRSIKRDWTKKAMPILDRCTTASEKDFVIEAAAAANVAIFNLIKPDYIVILTSWLNQTVQKRAEYTCKGRIISLGATLELVSRNQGTSHVVDDIIESFHNLVEGPYNTEIKANSVHAITRALKSSAVLSEEQLQRLVKIIKLGLSDYTVDQRGDVGSLLRLAAIGATQALIARDIEQLNHEVLLTSVVKLAVEKLSNVRFQAWKCLKELASLCEFNQFSVSGFDHQADISSTGYYRNLISLLSREKLRKPLVLGLMSSVATGTEDLCRASTEALVIFMLDLQGHARHEMFSQIHSIVIDHLDSISGGEDRDVIPVIDFYNMILEQLLLTLPKENHRIADVEKSWAAIQKSHMSASSLMRIESLIRLYSNMVVIEGCRVLVLDKLSRLLLHKWPKVRLMAASTIFFHTSDAILVNIDWHTSVQSNKPDVIKLRKSLNVAGPAAVNALKAVSG